MHDLINDLAQYVSGNFSVKLQDYQLNDLHRPGIQGENELPIELLHFSYLSTRYEASKRFRGLAQVQGLRTFLPIHQSRDFLKDFRYLTTLFFSDIQPKFQRLRALTLSDYKISVVPDSIGDLKHLRFFNLARTEIRTLPNVIGKCLNLQTLILKECKHLEELPKDTRLLINLRHLDIRGVGDSLIKRMEKLLNILKDIQNLSVVVDEIHGTALEHLGKLQTCQSLLITGLETVALAKRVELENKNCIENLTLEWSGIAECSKDELKISSELQPHANIKQLTIKGYRGITFPNWFGDFAFINMESLSLENCKNCFVLPPLGQLNALKKLDISGMDGVIEVGKEFYGNASIFRPFQALEELRFSKMAEWETWSMHSNINFPCLKELTIIDCPKLVGDLPFDLTSLEKNEIRGLTSLQYNQDGSLPFNPSLKVAKISDLPGFKKIPQGISHLDKLEVHECPSLVSIPKHVDKLEITNCKSLSLSLQSSVIKTLTIGQCKHVEFRISDSDNSCLESLSIRYCGDSIEAIPICSFNKLRDVGIDNWESPELFKFPNGYHQPLIALQSLSISNCNKILSFPEGGLPAPNLKKLRIEGCDNLKSLPEQMHKQLSSLEEMWIGNCHEIESFPEGGLPSSLVSLHNSGCKKLMICRMNWGLQRLPSLTKLILGGVEEKLFPEEGFLPSSLQDLDIWEFRNLETLNYKGLQHLTSLRVLFIINCANLRCFPEEKLSSSLSRMEIWNCENLESFPEDGITSSLSKLYIWNCPKLKAPMERGKGEDWPKVSHIPLILIDYVLIS